MAKRYFFLLLSTFTLPVAAQTTPLNAGATTKADTLKRQFRGDLPDSLASAPTPAGTFRLQSHEQPIRPFLTLQDQLRTVAGVQVTPYDGSPGSGSVVRIRGASVALDQAQPLYVVDGLPALNDELTAGQSIGLTAPLPPYPPGNGNTTYQSGLAEQHAEAGANPLQLLPPEAIESIEVLAGPAAVARYGPLGANGVIAIRTRRGQAGRPLRVRYSAYGGVQQLRQRYDLLPANEYAALVNEATRNNNAADPAPYPNTNLGNGTDWQAETYRTAGVQQHQVSLDGGSANTTYLLSADYRRQSGILRGSDLVRSGLRLALEQRVGTHLRLHGTAALGQTDQRLPYTQGTRGSTFAALLAPPTQPVRTTQGDYSGYGSFMPQYGNRYDFTNPLAISDYTYRSPRTRRLLTQVGADYAPLPHLTVQASANFQRTLLDAESSAPPFYTYPLAAPASSQGYATQTYRTSQWATRLAVRYQRQLGTRHEVGAELDYQYQAADAQSRTEYYFGNQPTPLPGSSYSGGYYQTGSEVRLHRSWASLHYTFDSTLTVQAGVSYAHYRYVDASQYYPNAELSWQARSQSADLRLWLGAARTGIPLLGYGFFGPTQILGGNYPDYRYQSPLYTDQVEAGVHGGQRGGHLAGQLVAYQRISHHALISNAVAVPDYVDVNGGRVTLFDEATIRNQGLELTLTATWRRGRLQGSTSLAASYNHNRIQEDGLSSASSTQALGPVYDNQPTGAFYGFQQDGLNADGTLRFRTESRGGQTYPTLAVIGNGIPKQLASLSQQLRLGRWALDAQLDGMFGYQVLNYQRDFLDTPTGFNNNATTVRDRWTPTQQNTSIPRAGYSGNLYATDGSPMTDRLLENGSNVRLSSLTITYRLRQTATQDISVWVGGQNMFVLTSYQGYDPNVSSGGPAPSLAGRDYGAVPVPRTWLLGIRASL